MTSGVSCWPKGLVGKQGPGRWALSAEQRLISEIPIRPSLDNGKCLLTSADYTFDKEF